MSEKYYITKKLIDDIVDSLVELIDKPEGTQYTLNQIPTIIKNINIASDVINTNINLDVVEDVDNFNLKIVLDGKYESESQTKIKSSIGNGSINIFLDDTLTYTVSTNNEGKSNKVIPKSAFNKIKAVFDKDSLFNNTSNELIVNMLIKFTGSTFESTTNNPFQIGAYGACYYIDDDPTAHEYTGGKFKIIGLENTEHILYLTGIRLINEGAFENNNNLKFINVPFNFEELPKNVFVGNTALENYEFPPNCQFIDEGIFSGCTNLKSIKLPNYNSRYPGITPYCFEGCSSLNEIKFPTIPANNEYSLGEGCFKECSNISSLSLPVGTGIVGKDCLQSCTKLSTLELPSTVRIIRDTALAGCSNLQFVVFASKEPPIFGDSVFSNTPNNLIIHVPVGTVEVYTKALSKEGRDFEIIEY